MRNIKTTVYLCYNFSLIIIYLELRIHSFVLKSIVRWARLRNSFIHSNSIIDIFQGSMPIGSTNKAGGTGTGGATGSGRTVMRPPWVKDGPKPIPMPSQEAPWVKRNSIVDKPAANGQPAQKEVKLQSREIKVPVTTERKQSIPEPVATVKPGLKGKVAAKPPPPPVEESSDSSSEYEEVTETETEESEEEEIEVKPLPIQVKLKPVEKKQPIKLDKSASTDKAGKFVRPVLKKVAKIDEEPKPAPPPPVIERPALKTVAKPEEKEPPKEEKKDFRPKLKKVDSTTKRRKSTSHFFHSFSFVPFNLDTLTLRILI